MVKFVVAVTSSVGSLKKKKIVTGKRQSSSGSAKKNDNSTLFPLSQVKFETFFLAKHRLFRVQICVL